MADNFGTTLPVTAEIIEVGISEISEVVSALI